MYQQKLACFLSAVEKRETHETDEAEVEEKDLESESSLKPEDQQTKPESSAGQARLESNIWSTARKHVVCVYGYKLFF